MGGRIAILIVNGFSPATPSATAEAIRYPWLELCLREVTRRSRGADYEIHVWDNTGLPEHRAVLDSFDRVRVWPAGSGRGLRYPHVRALDELVARTDEQVEYLLTLDTDAAPISDGWLAALTDHLDRGAALVGVWRDEMAPVLEPFVHPSCLCIRRDELLRSGVKFSVAIKQEPGQNLTDEMQRQGRLIVKLWRSNTVNAHFLLGGIYGGLVYHHGAGSRPAWFYTSTDQAHDERMRVLLRDAAFEDFDHLIAVLRGEAVNDIWLDAASAQPSGGDQPSRGGQPEFGVSSGRRRALLASERAIAVQAARLPPDGLVMVIGDGGERQRGWLAEHCGAVEVIGPGIPTSQASRQHGRTVAADPGRLPFRAGCADAVVLLDALCSIDSGARAASLAEASFVLKPGGIVVAAALGRLLPVNAAVALNTIGAPSVMESLRHQVIDGVAEMGGAAVKTHRPEDLKEAFAEAAFIAVEVLALDGFFCWLSDIEWRLRDRRSRAALLAALSDLERDPALLGISESLLVVARRGEVPVATGDSPTPCVKGPSMPAIREVATPSSLYGEASSRRRPAGTGSACLRSDPIMAMYYAAGVELGRLETKNFLEFERTKAILAERLPVHGRVIDIGGGPGTYAAWMAARGLEVDLVDPIPLHVEQARRASRAGAPFQAHLGDARELPFPDRVADAAVMMGPLFHLVDPDDRAHALREVHRVLRPGGVVVASAMGRMFLPCKAIVDNTIRSRQELERVTAIAATGFRLNPPTPFPAYAHRPQELRAEMAAAGFDGVELLGIEGFFYLLGDLPSRFGDRDSWDALLEVLHVFEGDPGIVGISGHLMAVGHRRLQTGRRSNDRSNRRWGIPSAPPSPTAPG